jgi:hypothetical protein
VKIFRPLRIAYKPFFRPREGVKYPLKHYILGSFSSAAQTPRGLNAGQKWPKKLIFRLCEANQVNPLPASQHVLSS